MIEILLYEESRFGFIGRELPCFPGRFFSLIKSLLRIVRTKVPARKNFFLNDHQRVLRSTQMKKPLNQKIQRLLYTRRDSNPKPSDP